MNSSKQSKLTAVEAEVIMILAKEYAMALARHSFQYSEERERKTEAAEQALQDFVNKLAGG